MALKKPVSDFACCSYPRGGLEYLDRLVGWAKDADVKVIMDLHGGPGAQFPNQQYTGHVSLNILT